MTTTELAAAVEAHTLAAEAFKHREHVQLGWHYLQQHPLLEAVQRFATAIESFATHHGAHDKYDEKITVLYMLLIEERRRLGPDADWATFADRNPDLLGDGFALLKRRLGDTLTYSRFKA